MSNSQGHPAYQSILNALPESLHSTILPELQKWDQGVQQKLQEIRDQYKPYEAFTPLIEANVNPQFVNQSVQLAQELQRDPKSLVEKINDNWNLGYVDGATVQSNSNVNSSEEPFNNDDGADISKHPVVQQLMQQVQQMSQTFEQRTQQEQEEAEIAQFEQELDAFLEDKPTVNRMLITAFMSQGLTAEAALAEYNKTVAGNVTLDSVQQQNQNGQAAGNGDGAPVVMGGDGTTGSGLPEQSINFGTMSKNDLNASVEAMILAQQQNNQ